MKQGTRKNKYVILAILLIGILSFSCKQTTKEVSAPQADLYKDMGITEEDSLVNNIVNLKGLYRLQPADKSISVDIKVNFKEDNNSDWITNIDGNEDKIPKKYKVFADALYITHDLEEFNRVISEQRKKGRDVTATIVEEMISKIPAVDKYRIELTNSDTIKLFGSRINFNLIKIE